MSIFLDVSALKVIYLHELEWLLRSLIVPYVLYSSWPPVTILRCLFPLHFNMWRKLATMAFLQGLALTKFCKDQGNLLTYEMRVYLVEVQTSKNQTTSHFLWLIRSCLEWGRVYSCVSGPRLPVQKWRERDYWADRRSCWLRPPWRRMTDDECNGFPALLSSKQPDLSSALSETETLSPGFPPMLAYVT